MAQAASCSTLSVAIIRDRTGYLISNESQKIQDAILRQIISKASSTKQDEEDRKILRPIFNRESMFEDGAIKMWCGNDQTLAWLKLAVSTYDQSLVVKGQSEIQKRHTCKFEINNKLINTYNIGSILSYQNSWVDFKRWEVVSSTYHRQKDSFEQILVCKLSIPEDQVLHLMKAECRLSIGLTVVSVVFLDSSGGPLSYPWGWNNQTKQFIS